MLPSAAVRDVLDYDSELQSENFCLGTVGEYTIVTAEFSDWLREPSVVYKTFKPA